MKARPWFGIALATVLALGTIACSSQNDATPTASPIPTPTRAPFSPTYAVTFAPTPVPTPNPSALAIRPCHAEDLVVQVGHDMGSGQHLNVSFGVANVSRDSCRVRGAPTVDLLDANGNVVGNGATCAALHPDTCANVVTVLEPGPRPEPSSGPYAAFFVISWPTPILIGASCDGETTPLAIELPDNGGRIDLGDVGMPSCSIASTSEFATPEPPTPTPDPTVGYR